jgi:CDGSH-type Zn-finger protein
VNFRRPSFTPSEFRVKQKFVAKNGPYIVTGEVELIDADGNKFPVEKRMALCRCGASTEKPFCDGTHSKVGFKAAEKAVPESKE